MTWMKVFTLYTAVFTAIILFLVLPVILAGCNDPNNSGNIYTTQVICTMKDKTVLKSPLVQSSDSNIWESAPNGYWVSDNQTFHPGDDAVSCSVQATYTKEQ